MGSCLLRKCRLIQKNLDSFQQSSNLSENDLFIKKTNELFIISFFQLQTVDNDGIKYEYGCLQNQYFIKLVEFSHKIYPSLSVNKIYSITEK